MASSIIQKIIFAMGTTGTQQATKSFAAMAVKVAATGAAIAIAVKSMSEMYDAAVTLDRQLQALNTDMSLYNSETKGLIDTNDGLAAAIQLQNAEIKVSKEEMAALGKAAIDMNQKLGGKAGGSTEIFNGLVKSVVNARETGLVKFGIELSQTSDKAAASQEALQKLTDKFGGVEVSAETAKEKMYAFNNSFGTVAAAEFNGILNNMNLLFMDSVDAILGSSNAMADYENDIINTNGAISDYMWTMDGMMLRTGTWLATITNETELLGRLNDRYADKVSFMEREIELNAKLKATTATKELLQGFGAAGKSGDDRTRQILGRRIQSQLSGKTRGEMTKLEKFAFDQGIMDEKFRDVTTKPSKRSRGGGGRRKSKSKPVQDSMNFSLSEIETYDNVRDDMTITEDDLNNSIFSQSSGSGTSDFSGGVGDLGLDQIATQRIEMNRTMFSHLLGMEQQYLDESNRMNAISNEQKAQAVTDLGSTTVGIMDNTAKAVDASSRKGFKATQAMNYASNAINTVQSSIAGYKSVMNSAVPFPLNVIAGGALATSIGVAGAVAGNKIRSQKYGSTSGSSSVKVPKTSFPSGGIGTGGGSAGGDTVINVRVGGNTIHREVMSANDLANQSGDKHFTTGEV